MLRFCADHGASLDFIYLADIAILERYTSRLPVQGRRGMITPYELRTAAPEDTADKRAYVVHALIREARLARKNDTSGHDAGWSACVTLELAEELMMPLGEGCEGLARATGRGWARCFAATAKQEKAA